MVLKLVVLYISCTISFIIGNYYEVAFVGYYIYLLVNLLVAWANVICLNQSIHSPYFVNLKMSKLINVIKKVNDIQSVPWAPNSAPS